MYLDSVTVLNTLNPSVVYNSAPVATLQDKSYNSLFDSGTGAPLTAPDTRCRLARFIAS